ncbi:MAG: coiled-coil domain-containing protein [Candidatus Hermodarchaeota archaeon]
MSEEKNTLKVIDGTIEAVQNITKVLNAAKEELVKLENEKEQLEKDKSKLEKAAAELEADKKELEIHKNQLEQDKKKLEEETIQLEKDKKERDEKIGAMTEEQMRLLAEYDSLKVELNKLAKVAEESQEAEFNFERIKALLTIYAVLIEKIWQGQSHYRILQTLHGEREEMTREQLKNTTGVAGVWVIRAVNELANVDLLDFDEDTGLVKLKQRLFPKKALEEKKTKG